MRHKEAAKECPASESYCQACYFENPFWLSCWEWGFPGWCWWPGDLATKDSEMSPPRRVMLNQPLQPSRTVIFLHAMTPRASISSLWHLPTGQTPQLGAQCSRTATARGPLVFSTKDHLLLAIQFPVPVWGRLPPRKNWWYCGERPEGNNGCKFNICFLMQAVLPARLVGDSWFGASVFPSVKWTG